MITSQFNRMKKLATVLICAFMVSCGGGGSSTTAGIGGTGITFGEVTQFGSVYVNGVKFNTTNASFDLDDDIIYETQAAAQAAGFSEGMVIKVEGTTNADGVTGTATWVEYDEDVEGPVSNISVPGNLRSFYIFNRLVYIDKYNTVFRDDDFDLLKNGDLVEISGLHSSDTEIVATFVDIDGTILVGSEVELEGKIETHDPATESFTIGTGLGIVTIEYGATLPVDIKLPGGDWTGLFVEVDGTYISEGLVAATEIDEEEDDFGSDVDHISLEGIIADFDTNTLTFSINNLIVDASAAEFLDANENIIPYTAFSNGKRVEVEGTIISGTLFADEVELD